jgi:hypothetical protein
MFSTGDDSHPFSVTFADFNNDNQVDIAVANSGTNSVGVLLNYGNGSFGAQTSYLIDYDSHPYGIAIGDFNNDTWIDMAVANHDKEGVLTFFYRCARYLCLI